MAAAALFEPLKLGSLVLKNRVIMSAMTRNRAIPTNVPNDFMTEYYRQRAGAGLIISEGTLWSTVPGLWNTTQVEAWKKITSAVHAEGGFIFAQLWHLGRTAHPDLPEHKASGKPVYGPSAIAAAGGKFRQLPGEPGYVTPIAIDDPMKIVAEFKHAAINAKAAGFDGVEVHGAMGYIIHQFLDNSANKRTDKWGGSPENRARFPLEVLKALIEVVGADKVGIKLAPCGGPNDMGMPLEDTLATYKYFVTEVNKLGIAYILFLRYYAMIDPAGRGTEHDVLDTYKPLIKAPTLVFGNGGFQPPEAATAVAEGKMDAAVFGLPFIANPDLPKRIRTGKELNLQFDFPSLYNHSGDEESVKKGFVDYPVAVYD
ncbi:FMN-linked oxidoreductase [Collybia nuda]|uniref:FMN-linked oxidoreductase n=1 Tax=Collybia nuda TaxID=64659 RepID=A0A9P5YGN1_9AGAR|nr:FMN-linked oxidoreductase [Collybia nuda]